MRHNRSELDAARYMMHGQKSVRIKKAAPLYRKPSPTLGKVCKYMIYAVLLVVAADQLLRVIY